MPWAVAIRAFQANKKSLSGLQQAAMMTSLPSERLQNLSLMHMGRCPGLLQLEPFRLVHGH